MTLEQHLTADDVASLLKVSVSTVIRAAQRGDLRSVVIGRSRRFPESAIEEWLTPRPKSDSLAPVIEMRRA